MTEQWRPVVGYEGLYDVSDRGRVRNAASRLVLKPAGTLLHVTLRRDGIKASCYVHHVVAEAWIGPRPEGLQTLHGSGGPLDNSVGNLSYGVRSHSPCGTHAAFKRHQKLGEPIDDACRLALNEYRRGLAALRYCSECGYLRSRCVCNGREYAWAS